MKHYLVTTSVFIEHLQGNVAATEFLASEQDLVVSYVTYKKLLERAKNKEEIKAVKSLMEAFTVHWGTPETNRLAVELFEQHHASHGMNFSGAAQAAIAITSNLILVTKHTDKYRHIPKLKTVSFVQS